MILQWGIRIIHTNHVFQSPQFAISVELIDRLKLSQKKPKDKPTLCETIVIMYLSLIHFN